MLQVSSGRQGQLKQLQAAVSSAQDSVLTAQREVAAARRSAADVGAQAVLVATYTSRLRRLAALLRRYDAHLQQALAALGLAAGQGGQRGGPHAEQPTQALNRAVAELAADNLASSAPELQLGSRGAALAERLAGAGAAVILRELQGSLEADLEAANSWPAAAQPQDAQLASSALFSPLGPAFALLQLEQRKRWEGHVQRQQRLERLRAQVATARQALADAGRDADAGNGTADAACVQLAARQAGLRAELACLEGSRRQAEEKMAAAMQQRQQLEERRGELAGLEEREATLVALVRAMCAADGRVMRQWRQAAWPAAEFVEGLVLPQRQPLARLSERLLAAHRGELAAFRKAEGSGGGDGGTDAAHPPDEPGSNGALARLLDPLAHLKTSAHSAALLESAGGELSQLQPLRQQWAQLAAASAAQLAALQQAAQELRAQAEKAEPDGSPAALAQLRDARAMAGEGERLVGRARQALSEWWTTPAVTATPWLARGGKTPDEWLRCLADQQRLLQQRQAFTGRDLANSRR